MIRWLRQLLCRHSYVSSPHWLLDTQGRKIAKVGLLVCAKCGHCSLSGIHPLDERTQGGGEVMYGDMGKGCGPMLAILGAFATAARGNK